MDTQPDKPEIEGDKLAKMLKGRGVYSRKLWLAIFCLILLIVGIFLAVKWAVVVGLYTEFVGGVVGLFSIYCGANAASKWGSAKHIGSKLADNDAGDDKDEDKK
jgi:hypothetical protein